MREDERGSIEGVFEGDVELIMGMRGGGGVKSCALVILCRRFAPTGFLSNIYNNFPNNLKTLN